MHLSAFDLDKTLLTINSSYAFSKFLYAKGIFNFKSRWYCLATYFRFHFTSLSLDDLHHEVFKVLFKGRRLAEFSDCIESFLDEALQSFLNRKIIYCLTQAQSKGHEIILLSSSPNFLVGPIADRLNISNWASTEYEVDSDGRLCKISRLMNGREKAKKLKEYAENLHIPLNKTTAYSDSYEDLPFLSLAGLPVGVDPDRKLRKICHQKHWKIL